jgi:hypothetical protein
MSHERKLQSISDDDLLRRLCELLSHSRRIESELVAHIGEVDERRLYAREGSPSLFHFCTEVLHLSEAEAYLRIAAARASRTEPAILTMLRDGRLHLSAIAKIAPHLSGPHRATLLARATHKTKVQIEVLIAELAPKPDVPATMRKLPVRPSNTPSIPTLELRPGGVKNEMPPAQPPVVQAAPPPLPVKPPAAAVEPLAPARYKISFTAGPELYGKLNRLRALMRTSVPDGDLAAIIEEAVTEKLERLESKRFAKTSAPRKSLAEADTSPDSRYIPAPNRRAVGARDSDQCTFIDAQERRCTARDGLEFHHRSPYGRDGDHSVENLCLMCHAHNAYLAELDYGKDVMDRYRRSAGSVRERALAYGTQAPRDTYVSMANICQVLQPKNLTLRWVHRGKLMRPTPISIRPPASATIDRGSPAIGVAASTSPSSPACRTCNQRKHRAGIGALRSRRRRER